MSNAFTYKRGRIVSNRGFSVQIGRDSIRYEEAGRTMLITSDYGAGGITIFRDTAGRWDDQPFVRINESEISQILTNIVSSLEFKQIIVTVLD